MVAAVYSASGVPAGAVGGKCMGRKCGGTHTRTHAPNE
jgi:hypothetical protein